MRENPSEGFKKVEELLKNLKNSRRLQSDPRVNHLKLKNIYPGRFKYTNSWKDNLEWHCSHRPAGHMGDELLPSSLIAQP